MPVDWMSLEPEGFLSQKDLTCPYLASLAVSFLHPVYSSAALDPHTDAMAHWPRWIDSPAVDSAAMWLAWHKHLESLKDELTGIMLEVESKHGSELMELVAKGDRLGDRIDNLQALYEVRHFPYEVRHLLQECIPIQLAMLLVSLWMVPLVS